MGMSRERKPILRDFRGVENKCCGTTAAMDKNHAGFPKKMKTNFTEMLQFFTSAAKRIGQQLLSNPIPGWEEFL